MQQVTTVGYGDIVPTTDAERVFVIVCTFIGNGIFAFMVGRVTALASQMNASHQLFVEKMDSVNEFMHYRGLPHNLRKRIRAFYHSFWNRGIYFNENAILGDLTFDLQKDVARFLNQDVIRSVPFFIGMDDDCVNTIISRLITRHVLEGDVIVREGDFGAYMFCRSQGRRQRHTRRHRATLPHAWRLLRRDLPGAPGRATYRHDHRSHTVRTRGASPLRLPRYRRHVP